MPYFIVAKNIAKLLGGKSRCRAFTVSYSADRAEIRVVIAVGDSSFIITSAHAADSGTCLAVSADRAGAIAVLNSAAIIIKSAHAADIAFSFDRAGVIAILNRAAIISAHAANSRFSFDRACVIAVLNRAALLITSAHAADQIPSVYLSLFNAEIHYCSVVFSEQTCAGILTVYCEVRHGMPVAVECTFKAMVISTYRRPFLAAEVDIGGQLEKFTLIVRATVHLLCKESELFAVCYFARCLG